MSPPGEGQAPPRRILESPPDGSEAARLLRALPPPDAPEGARARVWRKVSAAPGERRRRWVLAPALAGLAALVVFAVVALRAGPAGGPSPVLALSSGAVEQPSPSRVRVGPGSRALVRVGTVALLLAGDTEVEIDGAEVVVFRGRVAVATAAGSPVVLRSSDRQVTDSGLFAAELVDSRRFERSQVTEQERTLLTRFGQGEGPESRLRVEAPDGYAVGIDGALVGRAPLRALLPLGPRALVGHRADGARLEGEAIVVDGRETLHVLREPAPEPPRASVPEPAPEPEPAVAPKTRTRHVKPGPQEISARQAAPPPAPESPLGPGGAEAAGALVPLEGAAAPKISETATAVDPDAEAYAMAKELLARGQPAEAAALFSTVARGRSSRAELSLYELGRTELRYLRDPAAARSAFSTYVERYPNGLLLQEVELSLIESELAGSDFAAARASMDRFLSRHPGSERRDEVMLLRANLDRDRGDCAAALERYRTLARGAGATAEDAVYFAAVCAQQLGRTEEARSLLQDSLQRFPSGRHADEARRALSGR